jgi:hypothetical protein
LARFLDKPDTQETRDRRRLLAFPLAMAMKPVLDGADTNISVVIVGDDSSLLGATAFCQYIRHSRHKMFPSARYHRYEELDAESRLIRSRDALSDFRNDLIFKSVLWIDDIKGEFHRHLAQVIRARVENQAFTILSSPFDPSKMGKEMGEMLATPGLFCEPIQTSYESAPQGEYSPITTSTIVDVLEQNGKDTISLVRLKKLLAQAQAGETETVEQPQNEGNAGSSA